MDLQIDNLKVLVTAGGSGIGLAIAEAFVREGARVHICDLDEEALGLLVRRHSSISASVCDVADRDQVGRLFDAALEHLGGLDCLVNNAGIAGPTGAVQDIDPQDWDRCLQVNLTGQFNCARLAIPHLLARSTSDGVSGAGGGADWSAHEGAVGLTDEGTDGSSSVRTYDSSELTSFRRSAGAAAGKAALEAAGGSAVEEGSGSAVEEAGARAGEGTGPRNCSIMNVSSQAGRFGFAMRAPYAASKWGVIGFTKSLALELGPSGVRVNALLPGIVTGARQRRVLHAKAAARGVSFDEIEAMAFSRTSIKEYVTPEQLADLVVYTASPRARTISGQSLSVCGDTNMLI
jgi:NAD(P)-dependent dehydrogenase (short-subunit alcohol dehydrogenase family)